MYQADDLARKLDVDLDAGVCHACLSFVAVALERGDAAAVAREVRRVTPDLWAEGLDVHVLDAVKRAAASNVEGAEAALADLERKGDRSAIARAVVRCLAAELWRQTRTTLGIHAAARDRLPLAPPELN